MGNTELINLLVTFLVSEWKWTLAFLFGLLSLTWFLANHLAKVEVKNLEQRLVKCNEHAERVRELTQKEIESSRTQILELKENLKIQQELISKFESLSEIEKKELVLTEDNNSKKAITTIDNLLEKSSHFSGFISSLPYLP